jgi:glycosyltransferase involved in cell wall biosynthesis
MAKSDPTSNTAPVFSVIIGVYDDWKPLDDCLRSLAQQTSGPGFEVIVVDDGSQQAVPDSIRQWGRSYPLTIDTQPHSGVSAARNRGIRNSRGAVLLFVDADCRLHENCLAALGSAVAASPQHGYFQLHLTGDLSTLVGRAEQLRLMTLQSRLLQPDGCIRYLNTAGFAIRRDRVDVEAGLFDAGVARGEDTLLLVNLMQKGELPLLVPDAIVQHAIPLSVMECFRKDLKAANVEAKTYDIIASKGIRIRMTHRERLDMLSATWRASRQSSIGRSAWLLLTARQALQRSVSVYRFFWRRRETAVSAGGV